LLIIKCSANARKVQYKAQKNPKSGGTGSGSLNIGDKGPTKTILIGYIMAATVLFHTMGDPAPENQSPFTGRPPTLGPKSELVIN